MLRRLGVVFIFAVAIGAAIDIATLPHGVDGAWHLALPQLPFGAPIDKPEHTGAAPRKELGQLLPLSSRSAAPAQMDARRPAVAAGRVYVAGTTITVPRLGVHAPVYDGVVDDSGHLPIAPGYAVTHLSVSAGLGAVGNYVVYGHDDIEHEIFRYLGTLRPGDRVFFRHHSRLYVYKVTGSQIVDPTDVAVLDATPDASLTMISCTPYGVDTQRIVVHGTLVNVEG